MKIKEMGIGLTALGALELGGVLMAQVPPPELQGLLISAELTKATFTVGEPILLTCRLTNSTGGELRIEKPKKEIDPPSWPVLVFDSEGHKLVSVVPGPCFDRSVEWNPGEDASPWIAIIPVGGVLTYSVELTDTFPQAFQGEDNDGFWGPHTIAVPGVYAVTCDYEATATYGGAVNWIGNIRSTPLVITVVAPVGGESMQPHVPR